MEPAADTARAPGGPPGVVRRSRTIRSRHLLAVTRPRPGYQVYRLVADDDAHRSLATHGYHVTPDVIDADVVRSLRHAAEQWLEQRPPPDDGQFHSSYEREPSESGVFARQQVIDLLLPALRAQVTPETRLRPSVFQCKPSSPASRLRAHQDAFLVDERAAYGLFAWVALTDITIDDGPLVVLPGSHRYGSWTRVSTLTDDLAPYHPAIERHARALELRAGQVVWFDNALIHGSLVNRGGAMRLGVSAVAVPRSAAITVPVPTSPGDERRTELYQLDPDLASGARPPSLTDGTLLGTVELDRLAFRPASLDLASRLHRALHPGAPGRLLERGQSCLET